MAMPHPPHCLGESLPATQHCNYVSQIHDTKSGYNTCRSRDLVTQYLSGPAKQSIAMILILLHDSRAHKVAKWTLVIWHLDLLVDTIAGYDALVQVDKECDPAEEGQQALGSVPGWMRRAAFCWLCSSSALFCPHPE